MNGKFWIKWREVRCRFRGTEAVEQRWTLVEQQAANNNTALSIQSYAFKALKLLLAGSEGTKEE